jgi:hypothetical protein
MRFSRYGAQRHAPCAEPGYNIRSWFHILNRNGLSIILEFQQITKNLKRRKLAKKMMFLIFSCFYFSKSVQETLTTDVHNALTSKYREREYIDRPLSEILLVHCIRIHVPLPNCLVQ